MANAHVAVLIPGFNIFGQERALINVAEVLRQQEIEVTILLHREFGKEALLSAVTQRGFPSVFLPFHTIWSLGLFAKRPQELIRNLICVRAASKKLEEIVRSREIDILIAGNWAFAYYVLPALRRLNIGFVYRHGDAPPVSNPVSRRIARAVFDRADLHVANCEFLRRKLRKFAEIEDVTLIRNHPVGLDLIAPPTTSGRQTPNRLLYAGQMSVHKGVIVLLDAFDILAGQYTNLELVLAGATPGVNPRTPNSVIPRLKASIARWGDRVRYSGHVDCVTDLFTDSTIHVCPSVWDDPSPNIIHEAKACSTPTVAFARGGIPELIRTGIDGEIVVEETPERLAAAIAALINRPDAFNQARIEARKSLNEFFDYDQHARAWKAVVDQATRGLNLR